MTVIEAIDLTKRFGGPQAPPVLDGINLRIEAGEVFGYLGPNGAGKTTTMRVLLGLLRPTEGTVRIFGEEPGRRDAARARLGVLLENSGLDDRMTAYQSLDYHARLYGVTDRRGRIEHLLEFVELLDERDAKVGTFSTGMKRKLGLARAIVHDPEILFLDEPSAGLDPEAQRMVRELLQELADTRNITVFINSHHLDEVQRLCTRIAILHHGRIRACDSVQRLRHGSAEERVVVRLADAKQARQAERVLTEPGRLDEVSAEGERVIAAGNGMTTPQIVAALVHAGLEIEEVTRPVRSLEEVYFEIVAREAVA
ncbi:MAG: ABC transporter ATP-binding protein [Armatimonadota bacterium]|nr:ABC transporter ATP-binding protein [Armatimonadota bacterium]